MLRGIVNGRILLGIGSLARLTVGVGYLAVPEAMARRRLAPDIRGDPEGRMSTRGFGELHVGVALATLGAAVRGRSWRELAEVNLGCAVGGTLATVLERRAGPLGSRRRGVVGRGPGNSLICCGTGVRGRKRAPGLHKAD
ncbi:MAG: hypothetical protein ACXWZM_04610 [Solirubrobacterales bacterium]